MNVILRSVATKNLLSLRLYETKARGKKQTLRSAQGDMLGYWLAVFVGCAPRADSR